MRGGLAGHLLLLAVLLGLAVPAAPPPVALAAATATVAPTPVAPGRAVTVSAAGLPARTAFSVVLDTTPRRTATSSTSGELRASLIVPVGTLAGRHTVRLLRGVVAYATAAFRVAGEWPMRGHDLGNTFANPFERRITAANVATLQEAWSTSDVAGVPGPAPVVYDGIVYAPKWRLVRGGLFYAPGLAAHSASSGALTWRRDFPSGGFDLEPTVVGDRVYLAVTDYPAGHVHALSARDGRVLWSYTEPPNRPGIDRSQIATMTVTGGRVYISAARMITALDAATGAVIWRYDTTRDSTWGAGGTTLIDGHLLTSSSTDGLVLDPATRQVLWRYQSSYGFGASSPVVSGGRIYTSTVAQTGYSVRAWSTKPCGTDFCSQVWERNVPDAISPTGTYALTAGRLFVTMLRSRDESGLLPVTSLFALDAATGAVLWRADLPESETFGVSAAGNVVYLQLTKSGRMYAFRTTGCGRAVCAPLWSRITSTPDSGMRPPVAVNGTLYMHTPAGLLALRPR